MKVCLHLADGFEEIEAVSFIDILRRAEIDVTTVSVTGNKEVVGGFKVPIIADVLFENVNYSMVDMIVLPGGLQGTKMLNEHLGLKKQLSNFSAEGKWIAAICAAPTILGEMGLLDGHCAVCYPGFENHLKGASISQDKVVVSNKIITSKGPGTSLEFALKIVEIIKGLEFANIIRNKMIVEKVKEELVLK